MTSKNLLCGALTTLAAVVLQPPVSHAVPVTINYTDYANEGFKDPVTGNQRRAAFELCMFAMANTLQGTVPITVDAYFTYGVGGSWGYNDGYPNNFLRDFGGVQPGVYYPISLANQKLGYDRLPGSSDITIVFNGDLDIEGGPYGERFYYGLDGNSGSNVDFITEAAHGFLRGVGFYSLLNPASGDFYVLEGDAVGLPDILTTQLAYDYAGHNYAIAYLTPELRAWVATSEFTLKWSGSVLTSVAGFKVPMYAPSLGGSDVVPYGAIDHFHPDFGLGEIMWPWYKGFAIHDIGAARYALADMGWSLY